VSKTFLNLPPAGTLYGCPRDSGHPIPLCLDLHQIDFGRGSRAPALTVKLEHAAEAGPLLILTDNSPPPGFDEVMASAAALEDELNR
jgi:hypothetical protein